MATNQEKLDALFDRDKELKDRALAALPIGAARIDGRPGRAFRVADDGDVWDIQQSIAKLAQAVANIPASVWNQSVGSGNAAGVLNHIDAKPAGGSGGAPFDVDAFIARIVATLPSATVAAIKQAL